MSTCKDCIHKNICAHYVKSLSKSKGIDFDTAIEHYCDEAECDKCGYFQDRSKFIEQQTGKWIRHKPDAETMRAFHMAGIGKGMSENSIFWTCSACGGWGTPAYNYCSNCGAKMDKYRLGG